MADHQILSRPYTSWQWYSTNLNPGDIIAAALVAVLSIAYLGARVIFRQRIASNKNVLQHKHVPKTNGFYKDSAPITKLDFSSVPPCKEDFRLGEEEPVRWYREGYIQDRVYVPTLAIKNLNFDDWILMDQNYPIRMEHKSRIIQKDIGTDTTDCQPEAYDGCVEMLECFADYLPRRFPTLFKIMENGAAICNSCTGETFQLKAPYGGLHPLYIAGRLIEDDLNILVEGPDGEYILGAVLSAFPAGFEVKNKMGRNLTEIHKPVPMYKEKMQRAMNKFFANVQPSKMVFRLNWSINVKEELFLTEGAHLYEGDDIDADENIDINQVQLRVERQVLRRLPRTKAICFLTKTYLYPLAEIAKEPGFAARLGGLLHKLPEKVAFYKRKPVWGKVILEFLDKMAEEYPELV